MILSLINQLNESFDFLKNTDIKFEELISALQEFDELAELENIKTIFCDQIRAYIFSLLHGNKFSNHNFHTILYGPPGIGKTTVAKAIAKIFKALNVIKSKPTRKNLHHNSIKNIMVELYDYYNEKKYVPENVIKKCWQNIKSFIDEKEEDYSEKENHDNIAVCGREDFVAGFSGQSALKTLDFLKKNVGKCLIIEEAYLLWTGENDGYGMEALTVLNRFIEENNNNIIVIITGYKNLIINTIFKGQPGLKRRFQWIFELDEYSPQGLAKMFNMQMKEDNWNISPEIHLESFFERNYHSFPHFGGDTRRFSWICKALHSSSELDSYIELFKKGKVLPTPELSLANFELAFEKYKITSFN